MRYLPLFLCLLALPAQAADRKAARIGAGSWVVAAEVAQDADRVCFQTTSGELLACAVAVATPDGIAELGGSRYTLEPATTNAAVASLTLSADATVVAVACRTVDGLELCSEPSSDAYQLAVVATPLPPTLIDVSAIREAVSSMRNALDRIDAALGD